MKQTINNILTKVALAALFMFLPNVHSWAAEDDAHDFSQTLQQLLNNEASISSINIAQQSYPVKKVIVSYRYNKTITNAVTVEVSVGGNSWGSQNVVGTDKSYSTLEFTGDTATGAIVISFTNNTGSGTGHGTFYVNNVQLVEGASSSETCATPTFTPAEGTYYETQNVTLSCATGGASIYYTTNGDDPTSSSTQYTSAISVSSTTTLKAIAVKEGLDNSDVASATYTIEEPVSGYSIDFETNDLAAYTDWTFENIGIHTTAISAHGGSYYGSNVNDSDNGVSTASIKTKEKVANPGTFTCYVSKESGNTTSSTWYVQVSSDGSEWTDVKSQSATSMDKGTWTEVTADLSSYSNVYVRLYYDGSTAVRAVDDISLTPAAAVKDPVITVDENFTISTTATITCATVGATIYYSYDNTNWTAYTEALNITSTTTIYAKATKDTDVSNVVRKTTTKTLAALVVGISSNQINIGAIATVSLTSTEGSLPVVTLSTSNSNIASIDGLTVTGVAAGTATITATWDANNDYNNGSKEFTVTVIDPNGPGTENNPYTVAQALENTPSSGTSADVYIRGIVSKFYNNGESILSDYRYRYYISEDGTETNELLVYNGKGLGDEAFTSVDDLLIGDVVVIKGGLTTYNSTKEVAANNYIVSRTRTCAIPTFNPAAGEYTSAQSVSISSATGGASIYYTTDGTDPTTESSVYSGAISVSESKTIKAIAVKEGYSNSSIATAVYTINLSPSISLNTEVQVDAEGEDNTISVTYSNFSNEIVADVAFYEADGITPATYDWIDAEINKDNNLYYLIGVNTGDARTAYFKVWALDGETPVYSNLVTVTQAEYIAPPTGVDYSLFSGEISEGDYIIYYNGKAMNNVVESDRLQYESIEPIGSVITTDNASIVWHIAKSGDYWTIYNASGNKYAASTGAKNKAQLLESGTDDMSLWTVSGSDAYEFVNKENATRSINAYLRNNGDYGFACYAESTGGALTLYKKVTSNITATLNSGMYWATFYSSDQYLLPEGCKAYYLNSSKQLHIVGTTGRVIPANTAVVIISDVETITLSKSAYEISFDSSNNILKGSTTPVAKSGVSGTVYVLGVVGGEIGFYKFSGENIPANKAYYNE